MTEGCKILGVTGQSESKSRSVMSDYLRPHILYSPWNSPGQNTGVVSHSSLQGIFWTQGWNLGLSHCRQILYPLSHQGSHSTAIQLYMCVYIYSFSDSFPAEPQVKSKNTGVGRLSLLQGNLPDPRIKLGSPALQADSLPAEPPGKTKVIN